MINKIMPGQVVISKSGRDKGRFFIIKDILDDDYVLITDGDLRKLDKPKKKKLKHLHFSNYNFSSDNETELTNKKIKAYLKSFNDRGTKR